MVGPQKVEGKAPPQDGENKVPSTTHVLTRPERSTSDLLVITKQAAERGCHGSRSPAVHKLAYHNTGLPRARSAGGCSMQILLSLSHDNICAQVPHSLLKNLPSRDSALPLLGIG
ncbi:Hypothetical predicted protein [Pelobates cultripes]|uniref:Uncharacterized protein n=1 Tax=Pelobates cultripes TaxID=61616 RepID=A0AAD1RYH1_PELCU|nr:Hypothetical predicted protein [Pelobates cultripes]